MGVGSEEKGKKPEQASSSAGTEGEHKEQKAQGAGPGITEGEAAQLKVKLTRAAEVPAASGESDDDDLEEDKAGESSGVET